MLYLEFAIIVFSGPKAKDVLLVTSIFDLVDTIPFSFQVKDIFINFICSIFQDPLRSKQLLDPSFEIRNDFTEAGLSNVRTIYFHFS